MADDALTRMVIDGYLVQASGWTGDNHWTWTVVEELVRSRPDIAWPILLELVRRAPDDAALGSIAAGPLEDYLAQHGRRVIGAVEAEAARNPRLREALAGVWRQGMPAPVWLRVQALAADAPDPVVRDPDAGPVPGWTSRQIELELELPPPMRPGVVDPESVAARGSLLAEVAAAKPDGPEPWTTPVSVELILETGPGPLDTPAVDVLAAVVETLALDRPAGLVPPSREAQAPIASRALIRQARLTEIRSAVRGYRLTIRRMVEEQVEAMDDIRGPEAWIQDPEVRAFLEDAGVTWRGGPSEDAGSSMP